MPQTEDDTLVGDDWISLNTASGISIGTRLVLFNKARTKIRLAEGIEPAANYVGGVFIDHADSNYAHADIPFGSLEIWAKSMVEGKICRLSVQSYIAV